MIPDTQQLHLALKNFNLLPPGNLSQRYLNAPRTPKIGTWDSLKIFVTPQSYLSELAHVYPYHPTVKNAVQSFGEQRREANYTAAIVAAASVTGIFLAARRGFVLPFFTKYGRFFKTHRILRQYLAAIALPFAVLNLEVNWANVTPISQLWAVHARRVQRGEFRDPDGTEYPEELLPFDFGKAWKQMFVFPRDRPRKLENQGPLHLVPEYENPEFEIVELGEEISDGDSNEEDEE